MAWRLVGCCSFSPEAGRSDQGRELHKGDIANSEVLSSVTKTLQSGEFFMTGRSTWLGLMRFSVAGEGPHWRESASSWPLRWYCPLLGQSSVRWPRWQSKGGCLWWTPSSNLWPRGASNSVTWWPKPEPNTRQVGVALQCNQTQA